MDASQQILSMLNKPYGANLHGQSRRFVCWHFCREVYSILGLPPLKLQYQKGLTRIAEPTVPCIVLFHIAKDWHSGVVWPDGLHFIHACSRDIFDPNPKNHIVRKNRLTGWPYKLIIEGYYAP